MKKLLMLGIFLMIVLASFAYAASMSVTDATFGGNKQRRSNPDADDEDDEIAKASITLTVTNTGNDTITGLTVSSSSVDMNRYKLNITGISPTTLIAGATASITLEAVVPEDFPGVDDDLEETAFGIGTITVSGNGGAVTATSSLKMQAENQLEIEEVVVKVNGAEKETLSKSGKTVDEIKPGDEIELVIRINNNFDDKSPEDLEIDATAILENDDLDLDEDDDVSIDPEDVGEIVFTFEIDEDLDEGEYEMDLTVDGEDENEARHGEAWTITLEVERETYETAIRDMELSPETVSNCADSTADLRIKIRNIGQKADDEIVLKVSAAGLQYSKKVEDIDMEQNDEETHSFKIPVDKDTAAGEYYIEVSTFYKDDEPSHTDDIKLTVTGCQIGETGEEEEEEETEVVITNETPATTPIIAGITPGSSVEGLFSGSKLMLGIVIAAIVIAIAAIVVTAVVLSKGKGKPPIEEEI